MSTPEKSSSEILNELFSTFNSSFSTQQPKPKKSKKKKKKRDGSSDSSAPPAPSPAKKTKTKLIDKKKTKEKEKLKKEKLKKLKEKASKSIQESKKKLKKRPDKDKIPIGDGFVVFNKSKAPDVEDGEIIEDEVEKKRKHKDKSNEEKFEHMNKSSKRLSASQAYKLDAEEKLLLGYGVDKASKPSPSTSSSKAPYKRSRSGSPGSSRSSTRSRRSRSRSPTRPRLAPPRDSYRSSYMKFEKQREDAYDRESRSSSSRGSNYDTASYCDYHASRSTNTSSSSRSGFGYVGKSYYYDDVEESPPERRERDKPREYGSSSWRHRHRSRSRSPRRRSYYHPDDIIDKSELLEIARKNARKLLKSGVIGSDIFSRDQILAIKAGGKSVEDLTDYCKRLAKRDALGDARSSDEEDDRFIHHPFHVKDKPLPTITLNIRNAVPLPVRTPQELAIESAKLHTVFPVSSGTQHRFKEIEWKPVQEDDKKATTSTELVPLDGGVATPTAAPSNVATVAPMMREEVQDNSSSGSKELLAIEAPPPPNDGISLDPPSMPDVDISSVIGLRLKAMRALQEKPECNDAKKQLEDATKLMKNWADAKALEPKFLTPAELCSGPQAWAKRDQLRKTTKLDSGMGMHLLQKMGWRPGEGLGKNKEGQLEPLALDVKTDKKGLTAAVEELMFGGKKSGGGSGPSMPVVYDLSGKHPVSALMELTAKRRWGAPEFEMCFEHGPPHKRQFVYKVIVNGVEYQPCVAVGNKKQAKANAAAFCLQSLGLLPTGSVQANELLQTVQKDEDNPPLPPPPSEGSVNALGRTFTSSVFLQTVKTDDQLMPPPKLPT